MRLSLEEKQKLIDIYNSFYHDERILKMKEIPMHRGSNCFLHSFRVAKLSIKRALRHKHVDLETILIASILHDYYLYDWRKNRELRKGHGKNHPFIAAKKAKEDFNISDSVSKTIETHMWPFNIKRFPKTKEARIVANTDTHVATVEALSSHKHKQKRMDQYYKKIENLFD